MRKILVLLMVSLFLACGPTTKEKDLEIYGKKLISRKPPFTLIFPTEFQLAHSSTVEYPQESSLTRSYFFIKEKEKQIEEMFIIQIADRTNPRAVPINAPPLKSDSEKRMYLNEKIEKGELAVDTMIQLIRWDPKSSSLQPVIQKGIVIPSRWALQGQFLFVYRGDHAVLVRYSRDVHSFGLKVSDEGKKWERESISGNEKSAYENFQKAFMEMIHSIDIKNY
jgi:hypothetical protein